MAIDSFHTSGHSPGPEFDKPTAVFPTASRCRVGLLGLGTIGSAVARRLVSHAVHGLDLTHIFDRRAHQKRNRLSSGDSGRIVWTDCIDDVLTSDVDVVVEAIGGVEPAAEWMRAALLAGKSVVTANKQLVARHGPALRTLAARQGRQLRFEAAVGGAMPIVRALEGLAGDRLTRIVAILNGTTNAVLSRMEATGCTMEQALAGARARGYAEVDPSDDLDGRDAAAKLAILCALGLGLRVDPAQIETRSAARIAPADFRDVGRRGGAIRQLAHAEYDDQRSTLTAWVAPAVVPRSSIFAHITGPASSAPAQAATRRRSPSSATSSRSHATVPQSSPRPSSRRHVRSSASRPRRMYWLRLRAQCSHTPQKMFPSAVSAASALIVVWKRRLCERTRWAAVSFV
ncbi:MAG: hypothetical protein DMF92_13520 [Acidobacteria bacterium]|nr:MAG: hypothetical protein DMF92_13520 [Acidobacteriota bacterium]